jgi:predicted short-subunit dehydrogenase-like oxidoreductase (DUF2520 family)
MQGAGWPIAAVLSREADDAERLAGRLGVDTAADALSALPAAVRIVALCVPDDAVGPVARTLSDGAHPWEDTAVFHTSGALTHRALQPLAEAGALTLSFHPLQTFTPDTPPSAFEGIYCGVEAGSASAQAFGRAMAEALGARPLDLDAEAKPAYHLAATLASNGLVALLAMTDEVLTQAGLTEPSAASLMAPLVEQTWTHLQEGGPAGALTGPAARGDRDTIATHVETLREQAAHLRPAYAAVTTELVRLAVRSGRLSAADAEAILDVLHASVTES